MNQNPLAAESRAWHESEEGVNVQHLFGLIASFKLLTPSFCETALQDTTWISPKSGRKGLGILDQTFGMIPSHRDHHRRADETNREVDTSQCVDEENWFEAAAWKRWGIAQMLLVYENDRAEAIKVLRSIVRTPPCVTRGNPSHELYWRVMATLRDLTLVEGDLKHAVRYDDVLPYKWRWPMDHFARKLEVRST